ncbi:hypothetical protein RHGRI_034165 [Rhododendron griersonianum]|uniref:Transposase n=1 Tax=Rhododendron griersonianum TaxID=479676 RepID=A0AAV6HZJ2_9ERIC|nr:hypothetical protein RHGRI_034165 [Rhododendron griersonianum]KAG5521843.1 hypothetical protein RHGRI_034165 [Rhododendron griersonianum]
MLLGHIAPPPFPSFVWFRGKQRERSFGVPCLCLCCRLPCRDYQDLLNLGDVIKWNYVFQLNAWLDDILYHSFVRHCEEGVNECWHLKNLSKPAVAYRLPRALYQHFPSDGSSTWVLLRHGLKAWPVEIVNHEFRKGLTSACSITVASSPFLRWGSVKSPSGVSSRTALYYLETAEGQQVIAALAPRTEDNHLVYRAFGQFVEDYQDLLNLGDVIKWNYVFQLNAWLDDILYHSFVRYCEEGVNECWHLKNLFMPAVAERLPRSLYQHFHSDGSSTWVLLRHGLKAWPVEIVNHEFRKGWDDFRQAHQLEVDHKLILACERKVHGSLARASKVRGQTPNVAKQYKKKPCGVNECWHLKNLSMPAIAERLSRALYQHFHSDGSSTWALLRHGLKAWPVEIVNHEFRKGWDDFRQAHQLEVDHKPEITANVKPGPASDNTKNDSSTLAKSNDGDDSADDMMAGCAPSILIDQRYIFQVGCLCETWTLMKQVKVKIWVDGAESSVLGGLTARFGGSLPTEAKDGARFPAVSTSPSNCCSNSSSKLSNDKRIQIFNQKTLYNAYKKRTRNVEIDIKEYNRMKEAHPEFYREASTLQYGKAPKTSDGKIEKMVKEFKERNENRKSFS